MHQLRPNETFANYVILQHLGRGAYGDVYRARERTGTRDALSADIALKIPYGDNLDRNTVLREGRIWIACSQHSNIVRLIKADFAGQDFYLVSEYLDGGTLRRRIGHNPGRPRLSQRDAVLISEGILRALEHLHVPRSIQGYDQAQAVLHRDLKPENILLQGDVPKVSDFGVARALRSSNPLVSSAGTLDYQAPEAFRNETEVRSDVWAVGVILYEMLAGRQPFTATHQAGVVQAIQTLEPPELPSCVPQQIREIVGRSLHKQLADRFASAREMREALEMAREDLGGTLRKQPQCFVSNQTCCMMNFGSARLTHRPEPKSALVAHTEILEKAPLKAMSELTLDAARRPDGPMTNASHNTESPRKEPLPDQPKSPRAVQTSGLPPAAPTGAALPRREPLSSSPGPRRIAPRRNGRRVATAFFSVVVLGAGGYFAKIAWDIFQTSVRKSEFLATDAIAKANQATTILNSTLERAKNAKLTEKEEQSAKHAIKLLCNQALSEANDSLKAFPRNLKAEQASAMAYRMRDEPGDFAKANQAIKDGLALDSNDLLLKELQQTMEKR